VSEYGYIGPCSEETITKYYGGQAWTPGDKIWNLHNNTFEKATVPEGIRRHYTDPEPLAIRDYLQYARLVQGLMYGYSLEAIRFYPKNDGALFWMYNDTWGEVGWTIIDYYLDRKPSFYYVKRAFAPVKLILRASEDRKTVRVMGVNDTPDEVKADLTFGYVSFDGKYDQAGVPVTLKPFDKAIVHEFAMPEGDARDGVVFARLDGAPLALLRQVPFRDFKEHEGRVLVESVKDSGNDLLVELTSQGYCHAVSLGLPASVRLSDEYFDMLPGDRVTVTVYGAAGRKDELNIRWL
jgi:beta-mannosidase